MIHAITVRQPVPGVLRDVTVRAMSITEGQKFELYAEAFETTVSVLDLQGLN